MSHSLRIRPRCDRPDPGSPVRIDATDARSLVAIAKLNACVAGLSEGLSDEAASFVRFARLAVNEAGSLAWSTPHACWFLPALADEKLRYARRWNTRQRRVGNGFATMAGTAVEEIQRWKELMRLHQQFKLATGRVLRSSKINPEAATPTCGDLRL